MGKTGINVTTLFLACLMFCMPVLACPNYTYKTVYEEVSSPPPPSVRQNYVPINYTSAPQPAYNYNPPPIQPTPVPPMQQAVYQEPIYYNNYPPQGYSTRIVEEHTYVDGREPIDKAIDRTGKVIGILGIGALLGAFTAAIFSSI